MRDTEANIRRTVLGVAATAWVVSIVVASLVITKTIDQVGHPGIGLVVFLSQGVAITATIVWAQFRNRRVMMEVMKTGLNLGKDKDA